MVFRFKRDAEEIAKRIKDHKEALRVRRQSEKLWRQRQRELERSNAQKNTDVEEEEEEEEDEEEDEEDPFVLCSPEDISNDSRDLFHWSEGLSSS